MHNTSRSYASYILTIFIDNVMNSEKVKFLNLSLAKSEFKYIYIYIYTVYIYIRIYIYIYTYLLYLLYKDEKSSVCPSVCRHFFRHAHNFAVSRRIDSGLARNVSHVFWHQPVCVEKFLTASVCCPRRFERRSVEDFCWKLHLHTCKPQSRQDWLYIPSIFTY